MATKKTPSRKTTRETTAAKTAAEAESARPKAVKAEKTETRPATAKTAEKQSKRAVAGESGILARAEADISKLLDSLNTQMTAAMHAFAELAAVHRGRHEAVIRTKPLDRATAMFQRLVTELVEDRLGEVLPNIVALRLEMAQRGDAAEGNGTDPSLSEFLTRGTQMLDQVLANAEVQEYQPRAGDAFDPLIHVAVGETRREDLAGDVVSETWQSGFRTLRGKVIQPARVKVNRR
jgi:molecular chaperone GrpE (heat shock protein)